MILKSMINAVSNCVRFIASISSSVGAFRPCAKYHIDRAQICFSMMLTIKFALDRFISAILLYSTIAVPTVNFIVFIYPKMICIDIKKKPKFPDNFIFCVSN